MALTLPSARLGITRMVGQLTTPDGRPGIEVMVIGGKVVIHLWRHTRNLDGSINSEKFYSIDLPSASSAKLGDMLHDAAVISRQQPRINGYRAKGDC